MKKQKSKDVLGFMLKPFQYLIDKYGFELMKQEIDSAFYQIAYKNKTTGVIVTYDLREQDVSVNLYKLLNRKIVPNLTHALFSGEPINGFGLRYIVKTKDPKEMLLPLHMYEPDSVYRSDGGLEKYIEVYAKQLREYCHHILMGDFSSFEELEKSFRIDYARNK